MCVCVCDDEPWMIWLEENDGADGGFYAMLTLNVMHLEFYGSLCFIILCILLCFMPCVRSGFHLAEIKFPLWDSTLK